MTRSCALSSTAPPLCCAVETCVVWKLFLSSDRSFGNALASSLNHSSGKMMMHRLPTCAWYGIAWSVVPELFASAVDWWQPRMVNFDMPQTLAAGLCMKSF